MAETTPIEIPLDGTYVTKQHPLLRDPTSLSLALNVRHLSGPHGTVERQPGPDDTTTESDADAVGLVPAHGDVIIADASNGYQVHRKSTGAIEQRVSNAGSVPAQRVVPCSVVDGGVLYAGGPEDAIMGAHTCIRNGYLVGIYTVRRAKVGAAGAIRSYRYFTTVTVRDAETGERVIEDATVQDFTTLAGGGTRRQAVSLGAIPLFVLSNARVALWWAEENAGRTGWDIKTCMVNVQSGPVLAVGGTLIAYSSTTLIHGFAVTGDVTSNGGSIYSYGVRSRSSDGRAELFVYNHATSTGVATAATNAAAVIYVGGFHNFSTLDIAVANDEAVVLFASAGVYAGSICHAVKWTDPDGTPAEAWYRAGALNQTNINVKYTQVAVTARLLAGQTGWDWLFTGQELDASTGYFPNQTTNFTQRVRLKQSWTDRSDVFSAAAISLYSYSINTRGFTMQAGNGKGAHGMVGLSKTARSYDAVDAKQGAVEALALASDALPQVDPAVDLATWQALSGGTDYGFCPSARIGVDRASQPVHTVQWALGRGHLAAKPQSEDGSTFAIAYTADPFAPGGLASNVRWARVDGEAAPAALESRDGVTYVAGGSVHTWDGDTLQECTPLPLPRMRVEEKGIGSAPTYVPAGVYRLNAIYRTRDARGVVHRSQPYPVDYIFTASGSSGLSVYVEIPLTTRNGVSLEYINTEVYCSVINGTTLYLVGDVVGTGAAATPVAESGGEFEFEIYADRISDGNALAYWHSGEQVHRAPPAMLSLAQVGDRVFGLSGEERLPRYTKPRPSGSDAQLALEWPAANEIPIPDKVLAIQELAERPLFFTASDAWTVYGIGPNKVGGGDYSPATRVARVGLVDRNLVERIPRGVVFKSSRGWWLIDREYGLSPFGVGVEDALATVTSMVAWHGPSELRLTAGGVVLVYNWDRDVWSYTAGGADHAVVTEDDLFTLTSDATSYAVNYDFSDYANKDVLLETNWIKPTGIEGDVHIDSFSFSAEYVTFHDLRITIWTDYEGGSGEVYNFAEAVLDTEVKKGDTYTVRESLPDPQARAFKFRIQELNSNQGVAATFRPVKLTLHSRKISSSSHPFQPKG